MTDTLGGDAVEVMLDKIGAMAKLTFQGGSATHVYDLAAKEIRKLRERVKDLEEKNARLERQLLETTRVNPVDFHR